MCVLFVKPEDNFLGMTSAISATSFGIFGSISNQLTPIIIGSPLQIHGFLYLIAGENLLAILFVLFALPETKVRSLTVFIGSVGNQSELHTVVLLYSLKGHGLQLPGVPDCSVCTGFAKNLL